MKALTFLFTFFLCLPAFAHIPADSIAINLARAEDCKKNLQYDKALAVYRNLYKSYPDNVDFLVACAETEVLMGKEKDALLTYERILKINPDNLTANIYMGNYYFLSAEQRRKKIDDEYKQSKLSGRVRNQNYKKDLHLIYITDYSTSKKYMENVIRSFPSVEAKRTLEKIEQIEKFVKEK